MPASVGFHPGFQWPLPPHGDFARAPVDAHVLKFASDEPAPVRRLIGNLLSADACPSPIDRRVLSLSHALFHNGAIILDRPVSRSVWFGVPGQPGVRVDFLDLPHLGIWTLPGANFLCIEPWQGHACPEGFEGEILEKPGMVHLAPGESIVRTMTISVGTREVTAPHP